MRSLLICAIVVVGVTMASDQRNSESESNRVRRLFLDSSQESQITSGLTAANHLFDKMDKMEFTGVTGQLISSVSSFLGAVGPFVGFVLSFFSGPSAELLAIKKLYTQVENRFDQVDVQFAQLRREVAFVATQVHFTDLESNINAVQSALEVLTQVTNSAGYKSETHEYIHTFDRTYESSGIKLYNAIIHGGLTTGGLFQEFMIHSTYDRKATQRYMLGTLNLLMRASALEMAYAQLKHDPNIEIKRKNWVSHFGQVKTKMIAIDNEIKTNYKRQMVKDINNFASMNPKGKLSNSDFSTQLYNKLTAKYYWRDVFVLASALYDRKWLVVHACDYNQHDNHGRTIAVASVDKTKHMVSTTTTLSHLTLYSRHVGRPGSHSTYVYNCIYDANIAYQQLPDSARNHCNTYAAAGVYCTHSVSGDIHVHASGHMASLTPHGANRAFLFG